MKKRALILPLLLVSLAAAESFPADAFAAPKAPEVRVAPVSAVTVRPGKSATVRVDCRVDPGFHINSNKPKNDLLKPTVLTFDAPNDIVIGKVTYPPGHDLTFAFLPSEKLNVYTGDFRVTALVTTARTISPGRYRVRGALKYQACDNRQCYPPKQIPVDFDITVQKKTAGHTTHNPGQSPHVHR